MREFARGSPSSLSSSPELEIHLKIPQTNGEITQSQTVAAKDKQGSIRSYKYGFVARCWLGEQSIYKIRLFTAPEIHFVNTLIQRMDNFEITLAPIAWFQVVSN